jgi:hypothetical protein
MQFFVIVRFLSLTTLLRCHGHFFTILKAGLTGKQGHYVRLAPSWQGAPDRSAPAALQQQQKTNDTKKSVSLISCTSCTGHGISTACNFSAHSPWRALTADTPNLNFVKMRM